MVRYIALALLALIPVGSGPLLAHGAPDDPYARYLGNEGILIAHGETKVLFDAFYAKSFGRYALIPDDMRQELMNGTPPYDGIDAVFVSHIHGDHFSPGPMLAYLKTQPTVRLFAPEDVIPPLRDAGAGEDIIVRITSVTVTPGDPAERFSLDGIEIDVVAVPHSGGARMADVCNLAFRVTVDGTATVIHLGDADPDERHYKPLKGHLAEKALDAAFPPYWFYSSPQGWKILGEYFNARQTIGIHVPAEAKGNGNAWRARLIGDLFTDPGETRSLKVE